MELKNLGLVRRVKALKEKLGSKTLILALMAFGILLLFISAWGGDGEKGQETTETGAPEFSLEAAEKRIEEALERIDGAGKVELVLTLKAGAEAELAIDDTGDARQETVIVSSGSGTQAPVIRRYIYPEYQGALVIAQGGGTAEGRLRLTEAVAALTGLSKDRITVLKMQEGR